MKYSQEIFVSQFPIVKGFVYHLSYYRCLLNGYSRADFMSEFWAHTIDAHLLQATINWCKVFGSDGCNDIHWKRLNLEEQNELKDSFLKGLSTTCGISSEEFKAYWNEITDFRNKFVAHTEIGFTATVPSFDKALQVAFFYDRWIRKVIRPDHLAEGDLKLFAGNLTKKIEGPLATVIASSATTLKGI